MWGLPCFFIYVKDFSSDVTAATNILKPFWINYWKRSLLPITRDGRHQNCTLGKSADNTRIFSVYPKHWENMIRRSYYPRILSVYIQYVQSWCTYMVEYIGVLTRCWLVAAESASFFLLFEDSVTEWAWVKPSPPATWILETWAGKISSDGPRA